MNDERELIDRLCTAAGMIMEDASACALDISQDADHLGAKLQGLRRSAADVMIIIAAAAALFDRQSPPGSLP